MQKPSNVTPVQAVFGQWGMLWQSLRNHCKTLANFMVHRSHGLPQAPDPASRHQYRAKARFYAYLPPSEEQRDWLEQIYHRS